MLTHVYGWGSRNSGGRVATGNSEDRDRLLERMSDGCVALDGDWCILELDDTARETVLAVADVPAETDLLGRNIWALIRDAESSIYHEKFLEAASRGTDLSFRAKFPALGGWFDVRVYPDADGVSVFFSSIADQVQREEAVRRRADVLGELYDVVREPDADFVTKVQALLGIGRRVLGTEFATFSRVDGDRCTFEVVDAVDDTIAAGDTVDLTWTNCEQVVLTEERLVLSDIASADPEVATESGNEALGLSCYVGTPIEVGDDIYGTLCFYDRSPKSEPFSEWEVGLIDLMGLLITYELERERSERRLRNRNERLEEFRQVLAHDLRNPLMVAQGYADRFEDTGSNEDLAEIRAALDRIEAIIGDVSDIVDLEGEELTPDPVSTSRVAEAAWLMVSAEAGTLEATTDRIVLADESHLQRLFENLHSNAVTYNDGPVTVTVGDLPGGFYVEDDGAGIPESFREVAFEAGETTGDGSGIGLAIVREIAETHGWTCTLADSEGGGARFEFTGVDVQ